MWCLSWVLGLYLECGGSLCGSVGSDPGPVLGSLCRFVVMLRCCLQRTVFPCLGPVCASHSSTASAPLARPSILALYTSANSPSAMRCWKSASPLQNATILAPVRHTPWSWLSNPSVYTVSSSGFVLILRSSLLCCLAHFNFCSFPGITSGTRILTCSAIRCQGASAVLLIFSVFVSMCCPIQNTGVHLAFFCSLAALFSACIVVPHQIFGNPHPMWMFPVQCWDSPL